MPKLFSKIKIFVAIFVVGLLFFSAGHVLADAYGLDATAGEAKLSVAAPKDVSKIIGNVLGAGLSFISVVFFALMIWGGLRWMIARGNDEEVKKAVQTIYGAVIGLLIVLASYAITSFVFQSVGTGSTYVSPTSEGTAKWCVDGTECKSQAGDCSSGTTYTTEDECKAALGGGNPPAPTCGDASVDTCKTKTAGASCGTNGVCTISSGDNCTCVEQTGGETCPTGSEGDCSGKAPGTACTLGGEAGVCETNLISSVCDCET